MLTNKNKNKPPTTAGGKLQQIVPRGGGVQAESLTGFTSVSDGSIEPQQDPGTPVSPEG